MKPGESDGGALPVPDLPPRVLLDILTDCNLKCPMCIVHGETEDPRLKTFLRRSMSVDDARKVLDELMGAEPLIMPTLWSEPLMSPNFKEHVRAMKERGLSVAMNTNGLLLKKDLAQFLVDIRFDAVAFSVDAMTGETLKKVRGITRLDLIHRAVDLMIETRGSNARPRIGVSFTIQESNRRERDAFVAYWAPRVDFVRVGELYQDGEFPNVRISGKRVPCKALYTTMAVHSNGNVSICCLDGFGETHMGNVFEEGVKAVWQGPKLTEIRRLHETDQYDKVPLCKTCNRWAAFDYVEEVTDGMLIRRSTEYTYYNRLEKLNNWHGSLLGTHTDARTALAGADAGAPRK